METIERQEVVYKNRSKRFILPKNQNFQLQYNNIYNVRLTKLRPILTKEAKRRNLGDLPLRKTSQLQDRERCLLIGTLIKQQALRPSVLKNLADHVNVYVPPIRNMKLTEETDSVDLEDDMQSVQLCGKIESQMVVSGIVVCLVGSEIRGDLFQVEEVIYPPLAPQPERPLILDDKFVLFVSSLEFSGKDGKNQETILSTRLLADWLTGSSGSKEEQDSVISKVCRVVIAGNSISCSDEDRNFTQMVRELKNMKFINSSVDAMKNLDKFLARITACVPVDLMPGDNDPTNLMWPNQPLHNAMFPVTRSARPEHLNLVTNPYEASFDGKVVLGTDGTNLEDIYRFSGKASMIDLLYSTFVWQHLCPTAPDTLPCYPYQDDDPFMMSTVNSEFQCPDVFFAGSRGSSFDYKKVQIPKENGGQNTLILSLPSFQKTGVAALVNLKNLNVRKLEFGQINFESFSDNSEIDQA